MRNNAIMILAIVKTSHKSCQRRASNNSLYYYLGTRQSTLCLKKNDNDVLCHNFNAHQPILLIFGRDIAE